jgi:DNA-binding beta-propeller fold protein YncE
VRPGLALTPLLTLAASAAGEPLFVADPDANGIFRLETVDATQSALSVGGLFRYPTGVALHPSGSLYVVDPVARAVFRVNPGDGRQTLVTEADLLVHPTGIAVDPSGDLLVIDPDALAVVRVDPADGTQTLEEALPAPFAYPSGIAPDPNDPGGAWLVADPDANALYRFDRGSGVATVRSQDGGFHWPSDLGLDAGGDVRIADPVARALFRVDAAGAQTLVHEGGPPVFPSGADAVMLAIPVPSLAPRALLAVLAALILWTAWRVTPRVPGPSPSRDR